MLVALLFVMIVLSAGYGALRVLDLGKGTAVAGLAPAAGFATIGVLTTWCGMLGAPAPVAGLVVLACLLLGWACVVADRDALYSALAGFVRDHRVSAMTLAAGVLVPVVSIGIAFAAVQAPLSPHDGAFHVETSDAFRRATASANWYPPGLAATFGAVLQLVPWVDSAAGAYALGVGLTLLAPVATFGLAASVWRNLRAAAAAALLVAFTHLFTYYPQIWSGWPQLAGILLVIGLWLVGTHYLDQPGWRWSLLAGALVGAIVVVHGTELYTSLIVLGVLLVGNWRLIAWRRLLPHVLGAAVVAAVCAAPYLPVLLHWAGAGGAYQAGYEDGTALEQGARSATAGQLLGVFTLDALGVDFPVRIVLVAFGLVCAMRRPAGRVVVGITLVFFALAVLATYFNFVGFVKDLFSITYPWSLPYRHLTFAALTLALIGGGGFVRVGAWWTSYVERVRGAAWRRRVTRLGRLLALTWVLLATWALTVFLSIEAQGDVSFSNNDAAAMTWLREHVSSDDVVVNDTFADAGIWAPYKAGVRILFYRSVDDAATASQRALVLEHVASLDEHPEAAAAACGLNARYVYRGEDNAAWQVRSFPPLEVLRASPALEEVFTRGGAVVFRARLACGPRR